MVAAGPPTGSRLPSAPPSTPLSTPPSTPLSTPPSTPLSMRRSSAAANSGRGSTGTIGRRRASNGSGVMALPLQVDPPQSGPRAGQERLGGTQAPAEMLSYLRHRKPVEVTQRESSPLGAGEAG